MNIKEIYEKFDQIGSLTFATIKDGYPETRIAHFFAYDDEGLYFRTMNVKPFYKQLCENNKVSVCGLYGKSAVTHDEDGMPVFESSYSIRITSDVREVNYETIEEKSKNNEMFELGIKDAKKYPAMSFFVMYNGGGEIFDFDFERQNRDHKLDRIRFSFGDTDYKQFSLEVKFNCTGCMKCKSACSFNAIDIIDNKAKIDETRCDVCGNCILVCPFDAIKEKEKGELN